MSLPIYEHAPEKSEVSQLPEPPVDESTQLSVQGAQGPQYSATETYSREVLGTGEFELYGLRVIGLRGNVPPWGPHPQQSKYIVDLDESMFVGLVINFKPSPLSALLLCLGIDICATFHFEGFGGAAAEKDLKVCIKSQEGRFRYGIGAVLEPQELGLTPGYYQVAATVQVGPVTHKCGQYIFGYGYLGEVRVQIADQPFVGP